MKLCLPGFDTKYSYKVEDADFYVVVDTSAEDSYVFKKASDEYEGRESVYIDEIWGRSINCKDIWCSSNGRIYRSKGTDQCPAGLVDDSKPIFEYIDDNGDTVSTNVDKEIFSAFFKHKETLDWSNQTLTHLNGDSCDNHLWNLMLLC